MNDEPITLRLSRDVEDLVPGYLASRKQDLATMRDALDRADYVLVSRLSHRIHGNAGGYGFAELSVIGAELERAADASDLPAAAGALKRMERYLSRLRLEFG